MTIHAVTSGVAVSASQGAGARTGFRVEMGPGDPAYAFWAGSGAKNDVNATSFIKRNGDGYFKLTPHPAEVIGFDAWMRERTEAAHQAMMKHARRGGINYESKKCALRLAIPGTQVVLNSGGPVMTVIGMTYDGKAVACTWHIDGLAMGDLFPMECLLRCDVSQAE